MKEEQDRKSSNQEYSFIKEKIKEPPKNKKRIAFEIVLFAGAAVAFGLIASFVFALTAPKLQEFFRKEEDPEVVTIPKDEIIEEVSKVLSVTPEVTPEQVVNVVEKDLESKDYISLYSEMYQVADSVKNSLVTVVGVSNNVDWLNNPYENEGQASGIVVADNGQEFLILTDQSVVEDVEQINVVFATGESVVAAQKKKHVNTGLVILAVERQLLAEESRKKIQPITLGNSLLLRLGTPILAVGSPLGTTDSVLSGNVTSLKTMSDTEDIRYPLIKTDMLGSSNGNGVLLNLNGEVVGIYTRELSGISENGTITAYGISELKGVIERLSNNLGIAYFGVKAKEVSKEDQEKYQMPAGVGIISVAMESPAMNAGIQNGDIIVKIGSKEITNQRELENSISGSEPEQLISVTAMRPGAEGYVEIQFDVTLGVMP